MFFLIRPFSWLSLHVLLVCGVFVFLGLRPAEASHIGGAAPVVSFVSPTTAWKGVSTAFRAGYSDDTGVNGCFFWLDGVQLGSAALSNPGGLSGIATYTKVLNTGTYSAFFSCFDAESTGGAPPTSISVSPDLNPPSVTAGMPTTAEAGVAVTVSVQFSDAESGVSTCDLKLNGSSISGPLSYSGAPSGQFGGSYIFPSPGSQTLSMSCSDQTGNQGAHNWTVNVTDTTPPTVTYTGPTSATVGQATTITANYSDNVGVVACELIVGGVNLGSMMLSGGTASRPHTFSTAGSHSAQVQCIDAALSRTTVSATVNVSAPAPPADTAPPTVSFTGPISVNIGSTVTLTATANDNVAVSSCTLVINGVTQGSMTLSGANASRLHTFTAADTYSMQIQCLDAAGNIGSASGAVTVSAPVPDSVKPSVAFLGPQNATVGTPVTVSASYTDNVGVAACTLSVNGVVQGSMTISGVTSGTASRSHTFASAGSYLVKVECLDAAGNTAQSLGSVLASLAPIGDTKPPQMIFLGPQSAFVGIPTVLSAVAWDNLGVTSCRMYVNNVDQGGVAIVFGSVQMPYTFVGPGSFLVEVRCFDAAANLGSSSRVIAVTHLSAALPAPGALLKLACPDGAPPNHPCKAVYYSGADGKRHAFPNEKVYFTWYSDFSTVLTVADSLLASLPLGSNVTYRPGTRMVKFPTVPTVYAVSAKGVLKPIVSETLAIELYGSQWNKLIDDLSEAFYSNYQFGSQIASGVDFSPVSQASVSLGIDANL